MMVRNLEAPAIETESHPREKRGFQDDCVVGLLSVAGGVAPLFVITRG